MTRPVEEPKVEIFEEGVRKGDTRFSHPAFGQITCHRVSGQTHLYGSDFVHQHYVVVAIHESTLTRSVSSDWPHPGKVIAQVALSESQWAAFVSSMNLGAGVQCTIEARETNAVVPALPDIRRSEESFKAEGKEHIERIAKGLHELRKEVSEGLNGISAKKREELLWKIDRGIQDIESNIPWIADRLGEHMEETVDRAKTEVIAWTDQTLRRIGMQAIGVSQGPLLLETPKEENDGE